MLMKLLFYAALFFGIHASAYAHHECTPEEPASIFELADDHRAILIGELHGTKEMPAAFLHIVDELTEVERSVVIAIEHKATLQGQFDQLFASETSALARQRFEEISTNDGRSSEAMTALMVGLWSLIKSGRKIEVVAVDYWWGDDPNEERALPDWVAPEVDRKASIRDVRMGQNSLAACEVRDCDLLLYFAGNFHTNTKISMGGSWNVDTQTFERKPVAPAGHIISHQYPTAAIYLTHRGGEFYANTGNGMQPNAIRGSSPKYVAEDMVPYCSYGPIRSHQYVMSVGEISSSVDLSE